MQCVRADEFPVIFFLKIYPNLSSFYSTYDHRSQNIGCLVRSLEKFQLSIISALILEKQLAVKEKDFDTRDSRNLYLFIGNLDYKSR